MPSFQPGPNYRKPFGKNVYLASTRNLGLFESYTVAASTVPTETIDDATDQKVLQPGTVLAKITSGAEVGKVGPFRLNATDGRQTAANIVGINDTFLPYQLMHRDVEVAAVKQAAVDPTHCFVLDNAGARKTLSQAITDTNVTAANFRTDKLDILFRDRSTGLIN